MPIQTAYKHGSFSWLDLATTDPDAAKRFYGNLLGWTFEDRPAGEMTYTMCKLRGQDVAALYKKGPRMEGVPVHWALYVTVDDVDATTKKAAANGGKIAVEPMDVMDVGRMSMVLDPSGASLALWQKKGHAGAGLVREPGTLCWAELYTTNVDAAGKFYVSTLGWETATMDMGAMGKYTLFSRAGEGKEGQVGGMLAMPPAMKGVPSHWLAYLQVTDVDASTKKVHELGGKTLMPPTDIPNIGRFSVVQDPQGAAFALYVNAHGA